MWYKQAHRALRHGLCHFSRTMALACLCRAPALQQVENPQAMVELDGVAGPQAMMELGAVVCTQRPACEECPVRAACGARRAVEEHLEAGGSPATAPPVTQYPAKART